MTLSPSSCNLIEAQLANAQKALAQTFNWQLLGGEALAELCAEASQSLHTIRSELAYNAIRLQPAIRHSRRTPDRNIAPRTNSIDDL